MFAFLGSSERYRESRCWEAELTRPGARVDLKAFLSPTNHCTMGWVHTYLCRPGRGSFCRAHLSHDFIEHLLHAKP